MNVMHEIAGRGCEMKASDSVSLWASSPIMPLEFPLETLPKHQS